MIHLIREHAGHEEPRHWFQGTLSGDDDVFCIDFRTQFEDDPFDPIIDSFIWQTIAMLNAMHDAPNELEEDADGDGENDPNPLSLDLHPNLAGEIKEILLGLCQHVNPENFADYDPTQPVSILNQPMGCVVLDLPRYYDEAWDLIQRLISESIVYATQSQEFGEAQSERDKWQLIISGIFTAIAVVAGFIAILFPASAIAMFIIATVAGAVSYSAPFIVEDLMGTAMDEVIRSEHIGETVDEFANKLDNAQTEMPEFYRKISELQCLMLSDAFTERKTELEDGQEDRGTWCSPEWITLASSIKNIASSFSCSEIIREADSITSRYNRECGWLNVIPE